MIQTDVAIVGAGPAGLFAVFECGMLKLTSVLVDALGEVGGQCAALYPEKPIYDIPAHPSVAAGALVAQLEQQIAPFAAPRLLNRRVTGLEGTPGAFTLRTDRGDEIQARAVVIAAGAGAFGPHRPPLDGLEAFEASGAVQYYVRRRDDFRDKRVVIAGGGDSAVDWALSLKDVAARIHVVHRRPKFRAAPETAAQLDAAAAAGEIDLVIPYQLHALHGTAGWPVSRSPIYKAPRGIWRRMFCCRFSACRWIWGRSQNGAWTSTGTICGSTPRPARPACPACSPSGTWSPIPAS
jgi:thioredoxin reductase (NADPH)